MQRSFAELLQEKINAYVRSVKETIEKETADLEKFFSESKKEEKDEKPVEEKKKRSKQ